MPKPAILQAVLLYHNAARAYFEHHRTAAGSRETKGANAQVTLDHVRVRKTKSIAVPNREYHEVGVDSLYEVECRRSATAVVWRN